MVVAGDDVIGQITQTGERMITDKDFGEAKVNTHIGTQWNGPRVRSIDDQACNAKDSKANMNIQLRACGKREARKAGCHK